MTSNPSQPLLPADAQAPETRYAWHGIVHLLTADRATFINVATLNRRNAALTADALIRRLAESDPCANDGDLCHYCNADLDEREPHGLGCLWQDAVTFAATEAVTK